MARSIPITAELWGITPLQLFVPKLGFSPSQDVSASSFGTFGGFTQKWLVSVLSSLKQEFTCSSTKLPNHFDSHLSPSAWDDEDIIFKIVDRFKYCGDLKYIMEVNRQIPPQSKQLGILCLTK